MRVGLIFLPGIAFKASSFLPVICGFEITALVLRWNLGLDHMAHLVGILSGLCFMMIRPIISRRGGRPQDRKKAAAWWDIKK